jgi:acyl-CoA synthetase (NDP forming)
MTATFAGVLGNGYDLTLLVLDLPRGDRCDDGAWWPTLAAFEDALAASGSKGAVVASLPENLPEAAAQALMAKGVVPLCGIQEAMIAAEAAATIGEAWARPEAPKVPAARGCGGRAITLDEADAKTRLAAFGVAVPEGRRAASVEEAVAGGEALGFPLAAKVLGLAHKSEAGGLRLGLRSTAELRAAAEALLPLGRGLLVERQVEGGVAEVLLGLQRDPQLGFLLTLGAGGVLAELLQDSRSLLLPATEDEIRNALEGLKVGALLRGYRGRPRGDVEALVALVLALARFAETEAVEELDLNPVIVRAEGLGAVAADALIRIREETP